VQQQHGPEQAQVLLALERFQEGYTRRDVARLDRFMDLFADDAAVECLGTGGVFPGEEEWCLGREAIRTLIQSDWETWGDLELDVDEARIHVLGDVAWLSASGVVTDDETREQSLADSLARMRWLLDQDLPADNTLSTIVREATGTLLELQQGTTYIWPLRFTAVLVKKEGRWKFHQMQFSFPTVGLPDVRLAPGPGPEARG
jgi:ketosteroid isomerase-like protein